MTGEVGPEVNQRLLVGRRAPESVLATVSTVGASGRLVHDGVARRHLARVVGELANLDGSAPNDLGRAERGDEPLQLHLASGV